MTRPPKNFDLDCIDEPDMTQPLDEAIRRFLCVCFPNDAEAFSRSRHWHESSPAYSLIHRDRNAIVSHTGVVVREIKCADTLITVAGIENFCVAPKLRGTGLSRHLMAAALDETRRRGIEFGLLFCLPALERLHASLGWIVTDQPVTTTDRTGRPQSLPAGCIAMFIELSRRPFPIGPVDLQGADW